MPRNKKTNQLSRTIGFIVLGLSALALLLAILLRDTNVALLNPKGMIAHEQRGLMGFTIALLLTVAVPVVAFLFFTAWKYRESNDKATRNSNIRYGRSLDWTMWLIPSIFMLILALVMWPATHRLEPQKHIAADAKPLTIQVVSMRWKWLFIYPEQHIATVNYVHIPKDTPVRFELTADEAPMSSFWIPNLGGQLYTMTGMINRLNLVADTTGDYPGSSAEINGAGFAEMKFTAHVGTDEEFKNWINEVKQSPQDLDQSSYDELLEPGLIDKQYYTLSSHELYDKIIMKYMGPSEDHAQHGAHH